MLILHFAAIVITFCGVTSTVKVKIVYITFTFMRIANIIISKFSLLQKPMFQMPGFSDYKHWNLWFYHLFIHSSRFTGL